MKWFDAFTVFLLKCGVIPPWEIKLRAFLIASDVYDTGGSPRLSESREEYAWANWEAYVELARSQIALHRPRW